jgi:catalase
MLSKDKTAKDFVSDAFAHCKFIGYTASAAPLFAKAGIGPEEFDEGMVVLESAVDVPAFLAMCGQLRLWDRELKTDLDAAAFLANA